MFITKKKHDAIVKGLSADIRALEQTAVHFKRQRNEVRADAALDAAELAHWRQYGQLRDPKTGRLIPKREAAERKGEAK